MRIVVIARYFWPDLGGAQTQLRMLSAEWARTGHKVTLLTCRWSPDWPSEEWDRGYRIVRWPVTTTRFVGTVRLAYQIQDWLRRNRSHYDVVMVSMLKHAAWVSARSARHLGFPLFLKSWGAGASGDMAWQEKGRFGLWIRRGTKDVEGIFSPSSAVGDELKSAGYSRVIAMPNGVPIPDQPWSASAVADHRRRLGWPDRTTLVTTGRLSPEKGLLDLVEAIPPIVQARPDVQLMMIGEGPQREALGRRIDELGLGERVRMPGAVGDVEPMLRASDLYVLPSHFEGLSVALLESLVLGMPAVASDTPANRGVMSAEDLPLFTVGSPESLAKVVLERLARGGRRDEEVAGVASRARERYGIETIARQHVDWFERALAGRAGNA
jgi:glycosyltransferase involved in cell wall biosynthesis